MSSWSPDLCVVTGCRDKTIRIWRQRGTSFELVLVLTAANGVRTIDLSPDGETLLTTHDDEYMARLWHLDRLQSELRKFALDW